MAEEAMTDPDSTAQTLLALGAATLGESGARALDGRIRPAWPGAALAAPAYPVRCTPGDNLAIHVAVTRAPAGSSLVVDVGDVRDRGYWGEVLTTAAEARGLRGLVIDGCVRDCDALAAHGFPVFSTGLALPGATKAHAGHAGERAVVGGVEVTRGDWIVGDVDGLVVIPGDALHDVLTAAQARQDREADMFTALRGGTTTLELLDLDPGPIDGPT